VGVLWLIDELVQDEDMFAIRMDVTTIRVNRGISSLSASFNVSTSTYLHKSMASQRNLEEMLGDVESHFICLCILRNIAQKLL
jgi:hypothetical protein